MVLAKAHFDELSATHQHTSTLAHQQIATLPSMKTQASKTSFSNFQILKFSNQ
jgi:hypothetical protein